VVVEAVEEAVVDEEVVTEEEEVEEIEGETIEPAEIHVEEEAARDEEEEEGADVVDGNHRLLTFWMKHLSLLWDKQMWLKIREMII